MDEDSGLRLRVIEYYTKALIPSDGPDRTKQGANQLVYKLVDLVMDRSKNICRLLKMLYGSLGGVKYGDELFVSYEKLFEKMLSESLDELAIPYKDVLVEWNAIKPGVGDADGDIFFYYDDSPDELLPLRKASGVREELLREVDDMPAVFVYLLPPKGEAIKREVVDQLMRSMADKHFEYIQAVIYSLDEVVEK